MPGAILLPSLTTSHPSRLTLYKTDKRIRRALATTKDDLLVGLGFTEMLLKKLPDIVDGNPVKVAFGIAKVVLQIKDVCGRFLYSCLVDVF